MLQAPVEAPDKESMGGLKVTGICSISDINRLARRRRIGESTKS